MKGFDSGLAGGLSLSRTKGTKVKLAGRTAFLPNDTVPFVMQKLTRGQIDAIPKDRFSVSLIERPLPLVTGGPIRKIGGSTPKFKFQRLQRRVNQIGKSGVTGFVRKSSVTVAGTDDGTKQYNTIISLAKQIILNADDLYSNNSKRNPPDNDPPGGDIFLPPVDAGLMSGCIKKIILAVFCDGDKGMICNREIKLVEFCLLMHYYFIRIKILKNTSRQPFCEYLENYVFTDQSRFTAKTFNNYANNTNYKKMEKVFTSEEKQDIDFKKHPITDGTIKDFFHEIGYFFYNSPYFEELRDMRTNMSNFKI